MSKIHYIIDSRKKARIEKGISKTTVIIEDVVSIKENHEILLNYGELINDNERNRKKTFNDYITYFLYLVAAGIILLFFAILAIGKDFKILDSNYIDNIIGIAALIFGIVSIPRVKEWLGRRLSESKAIKKLWYIIIILFLPICIVAFMKKMGISIIISNICGIVGIIISILVW